MGGEADISGNERPLHLSDVYDKMIECWVSCLPVHIPGQMRLAKERVVRDVAAEVCLASLAVTVRGKPTRFQEPRKPREWFDLSLPVRPRTNFTSSHESGAGQVTDKSEADNASYTATLGMQPPTSATHYIREEPLTEDPTISRLRSYALSIRSQPLLSAAASAILDHWPTTPGINPSNYSWEATCVTSAKVWDQSSDEEDTIRRKKEEQRRQRAERFTARQRANADGATSQLTSFGSQPAPAKGNITSSQATEIALPMTQPDRGLFGSRLAQKSWKKRRTKGF
jgi:RNA polymerase I-specific transcription initiation factor RRN6